MPKYIQLYEEFSESEKEGVTQSYSWQDIRDVIQLKRPFIIIDFETDKERTRCINDELFDEKYTKQIYYYKKNETGEKRYPSVFIFGEETDLMDRVNDLNTRFDVFRIIVGEYGKDAPVVFSNNEQVDLGKNVYNSTDVNDMDLDDFYKVDSMFYKFIS